MWLLYRASRMCLGKTERGSSIVFLHPTKKGKEKTHDGGGREGL